jgi:uncharacterized glyoxalase superfamily protein PhnB
MFPYLTVSDAARAIDFLTEAFGAKEKFRLTEPSGRVGHAELDLGGITLMLADEYPELGLRGPADPTTTSVSIHLHVDDADDVIRNCERAGATVEMQPRDHFYGERSGVVRDPFGHRWTIGHRTEDVSTEEMQRRYDAEVDGPETA